MITRILFLASIFFSMSASASATEGVPDVNSALVLNKHMPSIELRLSTNPSTGYSWYVKHYDKSLIKITGPRYTSSKPIMPGSGGVAVWTISATSSAFKVPELTEIEMVYMRPFDLSSQKSQKYSVVLNADPRSK